MKALFLYESTETVKPTISLANRLRQTIIRMEREVSEGVEHEPELIERLREVLREEEAAV